jgi:hypothetical protein
LLKGTFKAGKLIDQQFLNLPNSEIIENPVTMMKTIGEFLAVGYYNGQFNLFTLDD